MGCAACFPALASLGAAVGLGFLSQYEGMFIRYLLPLFAGIALLANVVGGLRHRQWHRTVLGVIGPVLVLAAAALMVAFGWPTSWLLYPGLLLMVAISIWDFVSPSGKISAAAKNDSAGCCSSVGRLSRHRSWLAALASPRRRSTRESPERNNMKTWLDSKREDFYAVATITGLGLPLAAAPYFC